MEQLTHDSRSRAGLTGLGFAVLSAASFGTSGAMAGGLMDAGWSSGAAVLVRISVAGAVLAIPAWVALAGRWHLLRDEIGILLAYGLIAVAACQVAYFNAVRQMEVGPALLIEYTAPVAVLVWAWLRHGQRPSRLAVAGAVLAVGGLVLVLDLVSGASVSLPGVAWALAAMVGAAAYFILSGAPSQLPPIVLAAGALLLGAVALGITGLLGAVELRASTADVAYHGFTAPYWAPLLGLGVLAAAFAYVTGIAATRRLGARLASFVALLEVLFALFFAWLLLRELPNGVQLAGAAVVMAGVVLVKLGERGTRTTAPIEAAVALDAEEDYSSEESSESSTSSDPLAASA